MIWGYISFSIHHIPISNIAWDISDQTALWSGRVGPGRVGSGRVGPGRVGPVHHGYGFRGWKQSFFLLWTIVEKCFVFEICGCFQTPLLNMKLSCELAPLARCARNNFIKLPHDVLAKIVNVRARFANHQTFLLIYGEFSIYQVFNRRLNSFTYEFKNDLHHSQYFKTNCQESNSDSVRHIKADSESDFV